MKKYNIQAVFFQFFCNGGFAGYSYAIRGIERIGNTELLRLAKQTYFNVFQKFETDSRITSYWDIAKYLSEEDKKELDIIDTLFYEKVGEKLAESAYTFYKETKNKILV